MNEDAPPALPRQDDAEDEVLEASDEVSHEASPSAAAASAAADERLLRLQADFDNYRKRTRAERADAQTQAEIRVLLDMLPVLDNLHLALAAATEGDGLTHGVGMVAGQLESLLAARGVSAIAALGQPFDPTLHEAVGSHTDPAVMPGTVVHVAQAGYRRGEVILRAARVIVSAQ